MRLEGIQTGDIVEVDHNGRRFLNYYSCRSREVIGHWAKRGRPRQTGEPLRPSPRQLEIDLSPPA
ncbi:MAG: hypothetical protein E6G62_05575 [Actinobacteria bacterium]|nr:MAG: hypothetical protein E6G62_05575 [Actinomycetota bacterium]